MCENWDFIKIFCLIVEDNLYMCGILRLVLGGFGICFVYEVNDGVEVLEFVVDCELDIILCDWVMILFGGSDFLWILCCD